MIRYQCREIGGGHWRDCSKAYYEHCQKSPEFDTRMTDCEAVQCSDSVVCNKCALWWDVNDACPPECVKPLTKWHYIGWGVVALSACLVANGGDLLWALFGVAVGGVYLFLKRG